MGKNERKKKERRRAEERTCDAVNILRFTKHFPSVAKQQPSHSHQCRCQCQWIGRVTIHMSDKVNKRAYILTANEHSQSTV